jgi:hypothetical protein
LVVVMVGSISAIPAPDFFVQPENDLC